MKHLIGSLKPFSQSNRENKEFDNVIQIEMSKISYLMNFSDLSNANDFINRQSDHIKSIIPLLMIQLSTIIGFYQLVIASARY